MKKLELNNLRSMIKKVLRERMDLEEPTEEPYTEEPPEEPFAALGDTERMRQQTAQRQAATSGGDTTSKAKMALTSVLAPAVKQIAANNPTAMASIQNMPDATLGSIVKQLMGNTPEV